MSDPSVETDDIEALERAAQILEAGGDLPVDAEVLTAALLRSEAQMLRSLDGFLDLVNLNLPGGSIRFGLTPTGGVRLVSDNTRPSIRLARATAQAHTPSEESR